ncbi:tetratricopeptide repeat protein [Candidatus Uhrbacteria bacterium]|nr:tetratricopeptide repeat protein [Candidatus Uhrbacteria bacterium]
MPTVFSTGGRARAMQSLFAQVTSWATYLLFFLVPIFFLPWTSSILEVNKQMLLVILTVLGLVAWLGQMVLEKRLTFKAGWLNVVPAALLLVLLVSSVLSLSGYQTWVGQATQEYTSFLSSAMFVALFYMLMNGAGATLMQRNILFSLLVSASLAGLITLLGVLDLFHLPFAFAQSTGFNTIGTLNGFVSFMSLVMFVGLALWLVSHEGRDRVIPLGGKGTVLRVLIVFVTVVNLFTLSAIDFNLFWLLNIVGVLLLGVFVFVQSQEFPNPRRFAIPLVVLFVSVLLFFLPSPVRLNIPVVVSPSYSSSWSVATTTLGVDTTNLLFGSGPGTYLYDFLAYKPVTVNASQFWSVKFDRAKSQLITTIATTGILGSLLWLVLMVWVAAKALSRLILERDHEEWKMTYVMFIGWAILFLQHLLYSSNLTLSFLLWGFTGLLASQVMLKGWSSDFAQSPRLGLATSFAFVVVAVGVVASLFVTGSRYAAEVAFAKAVTIDRSEGGTIEEVIAELNRAVRFNGLSDVYQRNLSSAYLVQAREKIAEAGVTELTGEQTQEIAAIVTQAITAAVRATEIEPNYVSNWLLRGSVYRDVMSFAQGAEDLAATMFANTIQLEPINPVHYTNLGRVYVTVAERARALKTSDDEETATRAAEQEVSLLATAEQTFLKAVELKNDYLPAHYYLAAVYERQGKMDQATARLIALRNNNLADVGLAFQLSQLLIRLQQYDTATQELERILDLSPDYSNAQWYLASMYEISDRQEEAIELIERVVENNPDNEVARDRLLRMRAGEITTILPEPIQGGQEGATEVDEGEVVEEEAAAEEETTEEVTE